MRKIATFVSMILVPVVLFCSCTAPVEDAVIYGKWETWLGPQGVNGSLLDYYGHLILREDHTGTYLKSGSGNEPFFTFSYDEDTLTFVYTEAYAEEETVERYPYRIEGHTLYIQTEHREVEFTLLDEE